MTAKLTLDELLDQFKGMTVLELGEFVKRFEETFGVSAAFVVPSDSMRGRVEVEPEVEEPTEFDVVLNRVAQDVRIRVIKEIRAVADLGLAEAKVLVDRAPIRIAPRLDRAAANLLADRLIEVGAEVEVRPHDPGEAG